jgi:hydrogenase maturation protease
VSDERDAPGTELLPPLVAGVGNPQRGDDGAGPAVVELLRGTAPPGVDLVAWSRSPTDLIELWQGRALVVLVDAVRSKGSPGGLARFDVGSQPLPPDAFHVSTHSVGLAETVELARTLHRLPPRTIVFGVEGKDFGVGAPMTEEVRRGVAAAAEQILEELAPVSEATSHRWAGGSSCA